jgi:hypothetical protein
MRRGGERGARGAPSTIIFTICAVCSSGCFLGSGGTTAGGGRSAKLLTDLATGFCAVHSDACNASWPYQPLPCREELCVKTAHRVEYAI